MCGFTPVEFDNLYEDVADALAAPRKRDCKSGKARAGKYTNPERLFNFLRYCRTYPPFDKYGAVLHYSTTALFADFINLRSRLVEHPKLQSEVKWPSAAERDAMIDAHMVAEHTPPGFEGCFATCDGTKDLSKRYRSWAKQLADYSGNKGHGKTHLMVSLPMCHVPVGDEQRLRSLFESPQWTDLYGKVIRIDAGWEGRGNDLTAYTRCDPYLRPEEFFTHDATRLAAGKPVEKILMDGIFKGPLHSGTERGATIPFNVTQVRSVTGPYKAAYRKYNRLQRRLRVVIEQTYILQFVCVPFGRFVCLFVCLGHLSSRQSRSRKHPPPTVHPQALCVHRPGAILPARGKDGAHQDKPTHIP